MHINTSTIREMIYKDKTKNLHMYVYIYIMDKNKEACLPRYCLDAKK